MQESETARTNDAEECAEAIGFWAKTKNWITGADEEKVELVGFWAKAKFGLAVVLLILLAFLAVWDLASWQLGIR